MVELPETIIRLYLSQKGRCFHCAAPMLMSSAVKNLNGSWNDGWTREHIVPLSKRGHKGYKNVVLAHVKCNSKRGNTDPSPEMLARCAQIWTAMRAQSRKEVKRIAMDKALRGTFLAAYDYPIEPGQPKFIPPK